MRKEKLRLLSGVVALVMILGLCSTAFAAQAPLTRQEVLDIVLEAAEDYNPGVKAEDVMKGDGTDLAPDRTVTRAEALVMLDRAFGGLPIPVGDSARTAFSAEEFVDIPDWAEEELSRVLASGIVAGTGDGHLSPDRPVTAWELNAFIERIYTLLGTNLKDDFYAAVNKEWLDSSEIPAGYMGNGTLNAMSIEVDEQLAQLIADIAAEEQESGTAEAKIAALYHSVMDVDGRNAAGVEPIRKYLDAVDAAQTLDELVAAECLMETELSITELVGFGLTIDLADSTQYVGYFGTFSPSMEKSFYAEPDEELTQAYLNYRAEVLELAGYDAEDAAAQAQLVYDAEAVLSDAKLTPEQEGDPTYIYNMYTLDELQEVFPNMDLKAYYDAVGLKETDIFLVTDVGLMEALADMCDEEHLDTLKALVRKELLRDLAGYLSLDFSEASLNFNAIYYGIAPEDIAVPLEQTAAAQVQSMLSDYLSRAYAEEYFSPEAKADVEDMVADFIAIYKERVMALDWMSDETKAMAVRKLDAMNVKVGYPDSWDTVLDDVEILDPAEGGSYFSNFKAVQAAGKASLLEIEGTPVDNTEWFSPAYEVNAYYNPQFNDITFPAAILQAPVYDVNASREQNLGGIGYVIAHEITHAFDNNGAMYDENGNFVVSEENPAGWWTVEDYFAFAERCDAVVEWYDGQEAVYGVPCSGVQTLSENVADLGAAACIVEAASREEDPKYEDLFRAMASTWASTYYNRSIHEYLAAVDVHAPDKLRVNRVLQTIDQFYETFDITEGDGMWVAPEERVSIW